MPKSKKKNVNKSPIAKAPAPKSIQYANPSMMIGPLVDAGPILEFLENFQALANPQAKLPSRLISIKIPEPLLAAFRFKSEKAGIAYQVMIKKLMTEWIAKS